MILLGFFDKIKKGLSKTRSGFIDSMNSVIGSFTKIDNDLIEELEEILIMADMGCLCAEQICQKLKEEVKNNRTTDPNEIKVLLRNIIKDMLEGDSSLNLTTKPSVVMVIGVNGVGKTTTIGKMAAYLKLQGKSVMLAAADTFRAAAIEQLEEWSKRADVQIVKSLKGTDPASVVYDAISSAKSKGVDVLICDTAGRLHNKKNLMDELAKMYRVVHRELPDASVEALLVLDATTGQNAVSQAKEFSKVTELTGIVLTKLDGTAKGGVVVSIKNDLGIPVKFIGVGEQIDDLQPFDPEDFTNALFDSED